MQGAGVQSLVKELDPICCNHTHTHTKNREIPQAATKIPLATVKTWCSQISIFKNNNKAPTLAYPYTTDRASLVAQLVKNLPAMQETWVRSLGLEDTLEKGIATHSSIVAWRILWTEKPDGLHSPWGHRESDMTEQLIQYTKIIIER